ncbi:MAG TPA: lysophospholipid acyltransferase family protein [Candidatus Dormibacteraeota bacterium]|nr:lysophospholipid acyltransferase family protein [Candidatus Dormibacteraeota bacterium]
MIRYRFLTWIMRTLTRGLLVGGLFTLNGLENVPRTGALLVCPNHAGTVDPPLVPAFTPRTDVWSLAKSEYFRTKMAWLFRWYQSFPVVRHTADRAALKRSFELLRDGHALLIYPEGTRTPNGVLVKPEPGAGFIAQKSECAVVPVALTGTRAVMPKGARFPRRARASMTFGKPFRVAAKRPDGTKVSHQEASDAIMVRIAELLPADMRGEFSDLDAQRNRLDGVATPL